MVHKKMIKPFRKYPTMKTPNPCSTPSNNKQKNHKINTNLATIHHNPSIKLPKYSLETSPKQSLKNRLKFIKIQSQSNTTSTTSTPALKSSLTTNPRIISPINNLLGIIPINLVINLTQIITP